MASKIARIMTALALALGVAVGLSVGPANATDAATAAAADYYLNAVCPANRAISKAIKAANRMDKKGWKEGDRVPRYGKKAFRKASRAHARAGRMIAQYEWPDSVNSYDAETVAKENYEYSTWYAQLAKGNFDSAPYKSGSANSMRVDLGLPPAGTDDDGC